MGQFFTSFCRFFNWIFSTPPSNYPNSVNEVPYTEGSYCVPWWKIFWGGCSCVVSWERSLCVFNFFFQQNLLNIWNYLLYSKPWGCPLASDRLYVVQVDQLFPGVPINGLGWRITSFGSAGSATPSKSGSSLISSTHLSTFWSPWSFEGGESNCKFNFPTFSSDGYWVCSV